jgi:hypothetical protein
MKSINVTGLTVLTRTNVILSQRIIDTLRMNLRNQLMTELVTGKRITKRDRTSNVLKRLGKKKAIVYYTEKVQYYKRLEKELISTIYNFQIGGRWRWPLGSAREYAAPYKKKLNRVQMKRNRAEVFLLKLIQGNIAERDLPNYK